MSRIRFIVFTCIGSKLRPDTLKFFIDFSFIIFEKIAIHFNILISYYIGIYESLIENEIKIANICNEDNVLVVGCGSIPVSALLIVNKTNAKVVGIDNDKGAVIRGKKFIQQYKLKDQLKIDYGDAVSYPLDVFDVILILYGTKNIESLIDNIRHHSKKDVRIIIRSNENTFKKISQKAQIDEFFKIKSQARSESLGKVDSFLLCHEIK